MSDPTLAGQFFTTEPPGKPWWLSGKESYPPVNAGDASSISGSKRSPGGGNGNPYQHSCLGNPMDRGAWQATIHGAQRAKYDLANKQQYILITAKITLQEDRIWVYLTQYLAILEEMNIYEEKPSDQILTTIN